MYIPYNGLYKTCITEVEIEHEIEHSSGHLALLNVLGVSPDGCEEPTPVHISGRYRDGSDGFEIEGVQDCKDWLEEEWDYQEVIEMLKDEL